jgi:hypothetical protein
LAFFAILPRKHLVVINDPQPSSSNYELISEMAIAEKVFEAEKSLLGIRPNDL